MTTTTRPRGARSRRYRVTLGAGGYHTWDVYLRARSRPEAERLALATLSDPEGVEARAELDTETDPRT